MRNRGGSTNRKEVGMGIGKLVLIGNDPKCSRCVTFKKNVWDKADFAEFAKDNGAEMIDAGYTNYPAVYKKWVSKLVKAGTTIQFPLLFVLDKNDKVLGSVEKISGTVASVIKWIKGVCPDCCTDGSCSDDGTCVGGYQVCSTCAGKKTAKCPTCGTKKTCWTCKGKGKVAC